MTFNEHQTLAVATEAPITPELRERFNKMRPLLYSMMMEHDSLHLANMVKRHIFYGVTAGWELLAFVEAESYNYESRAARVPNDDRSIRLIHGWLGLLSEIPELAEGIILQNQKNIGEESGDCKWFLSLVDDANGIPAGTVARANILKLDARYPDKFSSHSALIRDLKAEDQVLSDTLLTE